MPAQLKERVLNKQLFFIGSTLKFAILTLFISGFFAPLSHAQSSSGQGGNNSAVVSNKKVNVNDIRVWRAPDHTRLVLDLSGRAEFSYFTLSNPNRVVIDLKRARLTAFISGIDLGRSHVERIRSGRRNNDNDLRLVLDVGAKLIPKAFLLAKNQQYGERLVIDLYDQKKPTTAVKTAKNNGRRDIVITLDAGHGGEDPGALGPKRIREKAVVMSIVKALQKLFDKQPGYRAVLTRNGDYYVSLSKRREVARANKTDFFISIHADAFKDKSVSGSSVYTLSQRGASSASAKFLADTENNTDLIGGVALADKDDVLAGVLLDLSMTATLDSSAQAGSYLLAEIKRVSKLHKPSVEHAAFAVLKSPDVPSVLVETGFISNVKEARRLSSTSHQKKLAQALFKGTISYFDKHAVEGTLVYWRNNNSELATDYKIKYGDTLSDIANHFSVSLKALRQYNGLRNDAIKVGQRIKIPPRQ